MFAKKNLIAVAALATLAVSAQAQSSVTLYGNVDVGLAHSKVKIGGESESATAVESSILTDSFFGLKGQEDLGGGLKAIFKLESSINVDTGAQADGNFFGKNAYVGVAGGFGTLTLGNQESLFKTEAAAFDAFGSSRVLAGSGRALGLSAGALVTPLIIADALFDGLEVDSQSISGVGLGGSWANSIGYTSPNLNGLTLSAQYSAKESADFGGAYAVAANYTAGPLALSAVYGQVKQSVTVNLYDPVADEDLVDGADVKNRAFLLGASYDFGVVKAFAQYGQNKMTEEGESGSTKAKLYNIGAIVPVTQAGSVHASFGQTKVDLFDTETKATNVSLAYHHALSKRSSVYAAFGYTKTEIDVAGSDDVKATTVAVGLRHAF